MTNSSNTTKYSGSETMTDEITSRADSTPAHGVQRMKRDPLERIADALERIADAVAGQISPDSEPAQEYPIIDHDDRASSIPSIPHIGRYNQRLLFALCPYCPRGRDEPALPGNPDTWLEYESSHDVNEQCAALTRHLAHHTRLQLDTVPLPIWIWAHQPCPRCHAPKGTRCVTEKGQPSTAVHAARWQDDTELYW
jgi:hypothetical protein